MFPSTAIRDGHQSQPPVPPNMDSSDDNKPGNPNQQVIGVGHASDSGGISPSETYPRANSSSLMSGSELGGWKVDLGVRSWMVGSEQG